ncbi:Pyocin activator protein PrtN [Burkholderia sp. Bp9017]|uniref:pyocin activator PrtN family protein n=1 Tax=unclassified Burkholderia TaxID=2613784 RepID=UPI000F5E0128|nr:MULTISPECIES: pyocin activator PrtN family protein [unclassified Burkholderia]RQZ24046.1 Pyocin activator protein PrtN [Burkholderia sp. Bp9017]RQZ31986.1 Pyocin activator protein PrtN [Burkholderia sp. Bp9016]
MNTTFILLSQFGARAIIPINEVCAEYFPHIDPNKLIRKVALGKIPLPITRIEVSQKSVRGVYVQDLADYIDKRRAVAVKERDQLCGLR